MNKHRLVQLNNDYKELTGSGFRYFYCPILLEDLETELCDAHIINKSFRDSDRTMTIQRSDVDSFFGSHFEAEFVLLQEKGLHRADEVMSNSKLAKKLDPKVLLDGEVVEHYVPVGEVPKTHTRVALFTEKEYKEFAVKIPPEEMEKLKNRNWELDYNKNLNLPSLVSLLKSAHLTLFHLLGYRHPFSAGGYFLGKNILGDFYLKTHGMSREKVRQHAISHFSEFVNMVRPVLSESITCTGTISDRYLYVWMYMGKPWALLIFINIANHLHAVALPVFEDDEGAARFYQFLQKEEFITEARLARWKGNAWEISSKWEIQKWPKSNYNPE